MRFDGYQEYKGWSETAETRRVRQWLSRRSTRTKAFMALGVLVVCGIVAFVVGWEVQISDPVYKYYQVDIGMTYDEVARIMPDLRGADSGIPDGTYTLYSGHGAIIGIYITFHDGVVTSKDIRSLPK